jgi:predicted ribosome quality control (RQC) complex YloA/Tae2 family protein
MLSLRELRRAARIIQEKLRGAVLRQISQRDEYTIVLMFENAMQKSHMVLSSKPSYARVGLAYQAEPKESLGSFCQYTRAHLLGGSLVEVKDSEENRQISLCVQSRSGLFELIFSILGARSNIYLLDSNGKLMHSMRPLSETRRELKLGQAWINPRGAVPSAGEDRWEELPDLQYLEMIEEAYKKLERKHDADKLAHKIAQGLKREREFLSRKSINLQEDLGVAQQAEMTKRKGDLLKSMLHTIRHGDTKAFAADYETGKLVEIPLDPKLSPTANMESYFAHYQKQKRAAKIIQRQLDDLVSARSQLDAIEQQLADALESDPSDVQAMERIAFHPTVHRLIQRHLPRSTSPAQRVKSKEKKEIPTRLMPKRYKTREGLEVWVGRSDEGNDYLTTRLARGNDLFFHLEGYPGSHVVLRTEGRLDPSSDSLLDACELAVHFSRLKNADSADVHVAPVKNIKKPKGAKPGLVYVRGGKTIHLRRDSRRLEEILAARLD